MTDLGTLVTIADMVFRLLQSPVLMQLRDWKSALDNLNNSVSFIKNMLLDADSKPELSHGEQGWVNGLKEVLFEADDLLDEVITMAKQKELNAGAKLSKKMLDKVNNFFSSKNHILVSYNTCQEVKNIQQKLAATARDRERYVFNVDPMATKKRRDETCSFLNEIDENIIGREDDVKAIVDMLLDPKVEESVGFIVLVGVGGLGKTAVAQLVFNHVSVQSKFEKLLWACVSDQDGNELDVQTVLVKIVESSTDKKPDDVSTMQSIQTKLRKELENKTYLLILDDVWTEDPNEWSKLRKYLTIGGKGSRVVVTTRSEKTAEVVLGKCTYSKKFMLKGLSDDDSWRLFQLTAFERETDQEDNVELAKIGKMIVKKCSNVPLAIKVLGTLLYGQTQRWESFQKNRLPEIEIAKNPIMSILKLSYNNLEPSVKNCFRYCALFPKAFKMEKQKMISLWMAQGYIEDSEDSFLILLKRCFFQDVKKDRCGDVVSFKMHDLMHDLAQEVTRDEFSVANCPTRLGKTIRHVFITGAEWTKSSFGRTNIRSCYMNTGIHPHLVKTLVAKWCCLRTLRLCVLDSEKLSDSIGELLHLRYLDLSESRNLKTLPNSITKLYNLQSLILNGCSGLKEWPEDFSKLVNLRLLDISWCLGLTCMPLGMNQLTKLRVLSDFKVGNDSSRGHLKDLKFLVNLSGGITIMIGKNRESEKENVWVGSCLENTKNLKVVRIQFSEVCEPSYEGIIAENEAVILNLQPHQNLKQLCLSAYYGITIPRWGRAEDNWATILPNLVSIELQYCERLQDLPLLSHLKHLKSLSLFHLNNLEYLENTSDSNGSSGSGWTSVPFFPSLEYLSFFSLTKLKGWRRGVQEGNNNNTNCSYLQQSFPRLSTLRIGSCPEFTSLPPCPSLKSLQVMRSNKSLRIITGGNSDLNLMVQEIDNVGYLTTLPASNLTSIKISFDWEVKSLTEIKDVFKGCSSLRSLKIICCRRLIDISRGLEHLTALESLSLENIAAVENDDSTDMPWRSLGHSLHSLDLKFLGTLEALPRGMKHLTTLRNLTIEGCSNLKGLPEWISILSSLRSLKICSCHSIKSLPAAIQNLTSLQKLEIHSCPELIDICRKPSGDDWPKIRHIHHVSIFDTREYKQRLK